MFKNNSFTIILLVFLVAALVGVSYFYKKTSLLNFTIPGLKPVTTGMPTATPVPAVNGTVQGTITIGPTSPNCIVGKPCARPYTTTILVKSQDGSSDVTTFTSSADGNYQVSLPQGEYVFTQQQTNAFPRMTPLHVSVSSNQTTVENIEFNTGLY